MNSLYDLVRPGTTALLAARNACMATPGANCTGLNDDYNRAVEHAVNRLMIVGGALAVLAAFLGTRAFYKKG